MSSWEDAYKTVPPWDVGRPQPAFIELVRARELNKGRVLDVGCGTGENALYLAENGFSVAGVDLSSRAIAAARAKMAERRLKVDFRAGNALSLHVVSGKYFRLCFSDKEPTGWGGPRRVTKGEIEATFSPLFKINYIRDALFETRFHNDGGRAYLTSATRRSA